MRRAERLAIQTRLEEIRRRDGRLTPEAVVEDARRDPRSPLRAGFDPRIWDESWAAHQARLEAARDLITRFTVRIETVDRGYAIPKPTYVHDPELPPDQQGYVPLASIRKRSTTARELLVEEFKRAHTLLERAAVIADELGLTKEFAKLLGECRVVSERLGLTAEA